MHLITPISNQIEYKLNKIDKNFITYGMIKSIFSASFISYMKGLQLLKYCKSLKLCDTVKTNSLQS